MEHGKTGYRCKYMGEFVQALKNAPKLDTAYIHERAVRNYSIESLKHDYQRYFERLLLLWDNGFDTVN